MLMVVTPTSRLLLFYLYATCCFLLSYHVVEGVAAAASPFSFSFDFSNSSTYRRDDLRFEGDAAPSTQGGLVDLTCNSRDKPRFDCKGRMSYNHPVPFYHTATGEVASFSTRFNFAIGSPGKYAGDGMAFFLSTYPSMLPVNSGGGNLGLHNGDGMSAKGTNHFVAVEFDTYKNDFDNSTDHIGIDVDTAWASVNTTSVNGSINGSMTAIITFNSTTRMLVASLHFDDEPSRASYQVSTQLTNPISDLLPSEVAVGFSAATGANVELHQVMSWSFSSTLARKEKGILVIVEAVGSTSLLIIVSVLVWFIAACFRWRRTRDSFGQGIFGLRRFEYAELVGATGRFSRDNTLGAGNFGTVYKGSYTDNYGNQEVAVKEIKKTTGVVVDFMAELKTISATRHMNLVELKGWCCSRDRWNLVDFMCWCRQQRVKLFLVYELVPNGTLEDHLHNMEETLPWEKRYQIVKGIGSAIRYLHHECNKTILHRDIKPGNILLDYDFNAKLADFGLSKIVASKKITVVYTTAIGTVGYMDPKCMKDGKVQFNRKSDVYSFGILLLEIASRNTREQVMELYRSSAEPRMVEVADEKLDGVFDKTQMERVIVLGLTCSQPDEKQRPYMKDAMKFLEDGIELPAITEINGQQCAPGTISSNQDALVPPELRG
uniref:Uncharacterized protein n=1 Tax=Avena sativa TaxID=4498 RepID=A0ACD5TS09_AVESA